MYSENKISNTLFVSELKRLYKDENLNVIENKINNINFENLNFYCKVFLLSFIDYLNNHNNSNYNIIPYYYNKDLKLNTITFPEGVEIYTSVTKDNSMKNRYLLNCIKEFKNRNIVEITLEDSV